MRLSDLRRNGARGAAARERKPGREEVFARDATERLVSSLARFADAEPGAGNVPDEVDTLPGFDFGHVPALEHLWNELTEFDSLT